jgi:superfamily I DNA/RNA helicase/mRNA-degrading endonuclease RelE of RelBE toxin-antitoxin system
VKVVIADSFVASLNKLDAALQPLVKQKAFDFQLNPENPGFKRHRLENSKDKHFWSIRINDDIRIIIHRRDDTDVLCYTDHHDPAYRWAEKRRLDIHPDTGAAQFVVIDERVEEVVRRVIREVEEERPVFGKYEPDYLQALGVPVELLDALRHIGASRLAELIDLLPEEAAERLLDLAEGRPVPRPQHIGGDPFAHPDAQRRFKVIDTNDELRQALDAGWEKWVVFLHPDQRAAVEKSFGGPAKVSGSAGTGKTVVALHRAAHLARAGQGRVLLTTFSSTLAARLEQHLDLLLPRTDPARSNIRVVHLHKLARDIWVESNKRKLKISDRRSLEHHLDQADRTTGGSGFDLGFLRAEWEHVVEPNDVNSWDEYRRVSRAGRGTALGAKQRKKLWEVFAKARASTAAAGLLSWDRVCHEVVGLVERQPKLQFRHVIADEVQDFGQPELRLLRALVGEQRDDLFMGGDPGQRIYKGRSSWAAVGINVRGRATRLRINYRTTEQIRRFSERLIGAAIEDGDGETEGRETISKLSGPEPELHGCDSVDAEIAEVAVWLRGFIDQGYRPRDIAVFARTEGVLVERAQAALEAAGLEWARLQDEEMLADEVAAIGTMHRAKGLEFKIVAVMGCDRGLVPLSVAVRDAADPADREEVVAQERGLLYVACTRARERVLVSWVGAASELL